jgi:hypothetical protein
MLHFYGIKKITMAIMKKYLFNTVAFLFLFSTLLVAQKENPCNCLCDFEYLKKYVETNHPGFKDQVTKDNQNRYEQHADSIRQLIKKGEQPCLPLLRSYTSFIRDRHMSLGISAGVEKDEKILALLKKQEGFDKMERIRLDAAKINLLKEMPEENVEGIYRNADGSYVVAMIRDVTAKRDYAGVIVSSTTPLWEPGQVKWELKEEDSDFKLTFWMRYFQTQEQRWDGKPGNPIFGSFYKESHFNRSSIAQTENGEAEAPHPFTHRFLNDSVAYMQIPSFAGNLFSRFQKGYQQVLPQMEKYPYWIIDIRGNGGGADQCLQALIPYLYTDTMWSDILDIYVTPENIARHSETLKRMESNASGWSPNTISSWKAENTRMQHAESFTHMARGSNKRIPYVFKEIKPSPQKVVLIYDGGSASSAETLIFAGMQSGKVVTFGENSFGATGYGEVSNLTLPGGMYQLNIPLTRYRYQGKYDTVGIPPMVKAKTGKDWVEQALELFSK